jgi:hypothetical protein
LLPWRGGEELWTTASVKCGGAMGGVVGEVGSPVTDGGKDKEVASSVIHRRDCDRQRAGSCRDDSGRRFCLVAAAASSIATPCA